MSITDTAQRERATTATADPSPAGSRAADKSPVPIEAGRHSVETERMLISVMMNGARADLHHKLMALLAPEDFFIEQHQTIWRIAGQLREGGKATDPPAILDASKSQDEFIGGVQYVLDAVNDPVAKVCSNESVESGANRVKSFAMSRLMRRKLLNGIALLDAGQEFEPVLGYVEDDLVNLARQSKSSRSGPRQAAYFYDAALSRIQAAAEGAADIGGISTGYPELDLLLGGGLPNETLTVLAGRPSMGKTAFALALEQRISMRGVPTLTFSLEMPGISLAQRKLAEHARVPFAHIRSGGLSERDFTSMLDSVESLGAAPCYIDETPGLTISEIRSRARAFHAQFPDCVIFVDYLQLVASKTNKEARIVVGETSAGLLSLARELKRPVVALAQLNRGLEARSNKRPVMSDLRESGQIEQDANVILFLYRDEFYNPDTQDPGITEVIVGKNRDGARQTVRFASDLSLMRYTELGVCASHED